MARIISIEEVKKHRRKSSVWIILHGDVYDVTSYLEEHPGGEDTLLEVAGQDGSQGFDDVGHSDDARELLKKFKIGSLSPEEKAKANKSCSKLRLKRRSSLKSQCSICSAASCPHIPRRERSDKTWRTYDGSPPTSRPLLPRKSEFKLPTPPRLERRVQSIIVPKQRVPREPPRPRGLPCESSNCHLKWAVLALAGALLIGFALKKYLAK